MLNLASDTDQAYIYTLYTNFAILFFSITDVPYLPGWRQRRCLAGQIIECAKVYSELCENCRYGIQIEYVGQWSHL